MVLLPRSVVQGVDAHCSDVEIAGAVFSENNDRGTCKEAQCFVFFIKQKGYLLFCFRRDLLLKPTHSPLARLKWALLDHVTYSPNMDQTGPQAPLPAPLVFIFIIFCLS